MTHDHRSPGLPLDPRLLELLRCPACHAELDGVPILLVDEARTRA
jgi:uncharacterized protein YbaR (Trm112 family)